MHLFLLAFHPLLAAPSGLFPHGIYPMRFMALVHYQIALINVQISLQEELRKLLSGYFLSVFYPKWRFCVEATSCTFFVGWSLIVWSFTHKFRTIHYRGQSTEDITWYVSDILNKSHAKFGNFAFIVPRVSTQQALNMLQNSTIPCDLNWEQYKLCNAYGVTHESIKSQ